MTNEHKQKTYHTQTLLFAMLCMWITMLVPSVSAGNEELITYNYMEDYNIDINTIPENTVVEKYNTTTKNDIVFEEDTDEIEEYNMFIDFINDTTFDTTPILSANETPKPTETNNTYPNIKNDVPFPLEPPKNINSQPVIKYAKAKKIFARKFIHQFLDVSQKEPIVFSVLLKNKLREEFLIFLTKGKVRMEPYYVIHVGSGGTNCSIILSRDYFVDQPCNLDWRENAKLKFWIWRRGSFTRGEISLASGHENPVERGPFITLKSPFPVEVSYIAFAPVDDELLPVYLY